MASYVKVKAFTSTRNKMNLIINTDQIIAFDDDELRFQMCDGTWYECTPDSPISCIALMQKVGAPLS